MTRKINRGSIIFLSIAFLAVSLYLTSSERESIKCLYRKHVQFPPEAIDQRGNLGPADQLRLFNPMGIAEDSQGNVYIADRGRWRGCMAQGGVVWKIDTNLIAHAVAGTGTLGQFTQGVPGTESDLESPEEITITSDGSVVFADHRNHVVLKISNNGDLLRVAGTGIRGYSGDDGVALEAKLDKPYDVKHDSQGNLYIAEEFHRVRKVSPDGIISTVAGTGSPGFSGDEGPAVNALLNNPYNIAIDQSDQLLIADAGNHRVRIVDREGIIHTKVGNGERGYRGDGGDAKDARLDQPQALFPDITNQLYIGDEHNHAIRVVDQDGIITTLIGVGEPGVASLGAIASESALDDPEDVLVRKDGTILVSDSGNGRVLAIGAGGRISIFAGGGISPSDLRNYKHRVVEDSKIIWK